MRPITPEIEKALQGLPYHPGIANVDKSLSGNLHLIDRNILEERLHHWRKIEIMLDSDKMNKLKIQDLQLAPEGSNLAKIKEYIQKMTGVTISEVEPFIDYSPLLRPRHYATVQELLPQRIPGAAFDSSPSVADLLESFPPEKLKDFHEMLRDL